MPTITETSEDFLSQHCWHGGKPYLKNERPLKDRIIRARQYLKMKAPVSVSKQGGRNTLLSVATHLIGYLDLPEDVALDVMTTPASTCWNSRCVNGVTNEAYPWSKRELMMALTKAKGMVPAFGVFECELHQKRLQRERVLDWFFEHILMGEDASTGIESCQLRLAFDSHGHPYLGVRSQSEPVPFEVAFRVAFDMVEKVTGEALTQKRLGMYLRSKGIEEQRKTKRRQLCVLVPGGVLGFYQRWNGLAASISGADFC